jgi:hypothetical protein
MDGMGLRSEEAIQRQFDTTRKGRTAPSNLREQVQPTMWPTPRSSGAMAERSENIVTRGRFSEGRLEQSTALAAWNAQTGKHASLNPAFVCWLMGYPNTALSSMLLAMRSFRTLPRNLSKQPPTKEPTDDI